MGKDHSHHFQVENLIYVAEGFELSILFFSILVF